MDGAGITTQQTRSCAEKGHSTRLMYPEFLVLMVEQLVFYQPFYTDPKLKIGQSAAVLHFKIFNGTPIRGVFHHPMEDVLCVHLTDVGLEL